MIYVALIPPCVMLALGALFAFKAPKFYGDWPQAGPLTRVVRRMFGAAIVMRLFGVFWIVLGLAALIFVGSLISN